MDAQIKWPAHKDATLECWENPGIPSGYTYLLQFVAHDLVHSAIPISVAGSLGADSTNSRRKALKLETLFGNGPVGSPFVYAQDTPNDERRTKLRLGRMRWKDKGVEAGCPFRDIARTPAENVTGIDRSIAGHRVALTEALVADPRNDDHAIMSQLTALFALLHNGLIDIVRRGEPTAGPNANVGAAYKRFLCARDALTLIYHNIIRKDLMRRAMHPAIYAAYSGPIPNFIDRPRANAGAGRLANPARILPRRISLRPRHGPARIRHQRSLDPRSEQYPGKDLGERSRQHAARFQLDRAMVALLRDRRVEAEFQPAHRPVPQRRAGQ